MDNIAMNNAALQNAWTHIHQQQAIDAAAIGITQPGMLWTKTSGGPSLNPIMYALHNEATSLGKFEVFKVENGYMLVANNNGKSRFWVSTTIEELQQYMVASMVEEKMEKAK